MPVTSVHTDPENLTMTLVADFPAPADRLWSAFTDPRQLERFWGPPGWPATFTQFDLAVGSHAKYRMTGPHGERANGTWEFLTIDAPRGYSVIDSFADEEGAVLTDMPSMRMVLEFESTPEGSRLVTTSHFESAEALEKVVAMGVVEGSTMAMNQLDRVLEGLRAYAEGKGTRTEILDDTHVRITRLIEGSRDLVWRAHTEPELMKRWLLGPDGWRMTVCEIDPVVGGTYRYAWAPEDGTEGQAFGFDGETLLAEAPSRSVTTEHMTGTDFPSTLNDLNLYEEDGATLITLVIEYPDQQTRDMVLATGMTDGMEASYARLEGVLVS
ncbi:SRPBCC family protein [Microbacterium sp.]|uniref:SRPBCC family protein n=1 Tax=Microbacterium sp. TaxID=51671 RepID=UPI000928FA96|nr:SRPBCC family protein [Microbacterium sp.]MBN9184887.1 SRPBCC domain-containing protein [Microbacterium sp.]MBN9189923.1 SRPBCC domain-containing protein [Microbacterium sp.]MBN9192346.1 SRPBCC domain-containing protein [Microbacterium sp.]OJU70547.1 MAG: ATPase [Microbacterium sp. 70-38]